VPAQWRAAAPLNIRTWRFSVNDDRSFARHYHRGMKLDFDPELLRTSMDLWRAAVDMTIPVHDDFKVRFLERRQELLEGFVRTSGAFKMVLDACNAAGADLVELDAIKAEVELFHQWAVNGLKDLGTLALQESMKDNVQQMLADPQLNAAIRNLLRSKGSDQGTAGS
jgi:hypothetical protein